MAKDPSLEQILQEVKGMTGTSTGDPQVDALVQGLLDKRRSPGIDPASGQELPTRVFLQSKKTAPPSVPMGDGEIEALLQQLRAAAPEAQIRPVQQAVRPSAPAAQPTQTATPTAQPARSATPSARPTRSATSTAQPAHSATSAAQPAQTATPAAQPARPAASPEQPEAYTTGPLEIDIDAIRADAPPPRAIPAQKLPKSAPPEEQESEAASEAAAPAPAASPRPPQVAPCFRREVRDTSQPGEARKIFQQIGSRYQLRGWILLLLLVFTGILCFFLQQSRQEPGWIPSTAFMTVLTVAGMGAGAAGWPIVFGGLSSFCRLRPDRDTPPALCWLVTFCQVFSQTVAPGGLVHAHNQCYLPLGILALLIACLGRILVSNAGVRNARFLHSEGEKFVPHLVEDPKLAAELTRGLPMEEDAPCPAVNRPSAAIAELLQTSLAEDDTDRMGRLFSLLAVIAGALGALITLLVTHERQYAVTIFTATLAIFTPGFGALLTALPLGRIARRMEKEGGIVCGQQSAQRYRQTGAVLLEGSQLLPPAFLSLAGIKTFEGTRIDEILLDAASVVHATDSLLVPLFDQIIGQRQSMLRPVDGLEQEEGQGLLGWVEGRRILIGSRRMMVSHDIRVPSKEYERRLKAGGRLLFYLASAGQIAAIFVLDAAPPVQTVEAVQCLADHGIGLVVRASDSFVTPEALGMLFEVDPALIKILPRRLYPYADRLSTRVRAKRALVVNNGSVSGLARSLAGARRLHAMVGLDFALLISAVALGTILLPIFALLGAMPYLTPLLLCGYGLFWVGLGWLMQKFLF